MAGEIDGTGVLGVALSPCLATGIEGDEEPGKLKRRECSPLVVVTPLMLEFGTACETAEMLCDGNGEISLDGEGVCYTVNNDNTYSVRRLNEWQK